MVKSDCSLTQQKSKFQNKIKKQLKITSNRKVK